MQRTIKTPTETDRANTNDKCWVTVSMTINLGNYENIKVESGFSQTIKPKEDPFKLMDWMQESITPIIEEYVNELKKKFHKKPKKDEE